MLKRLLAYALVTFVLAGGGAIVLASVDLIDFAPGEVIRSADVNTNFARLRDGKQQRVTGACDVGSSIRAIRADGSVECEIDDDNGSGDGAGGMTLPFDRSVSVDGPAFTIGNRSDRSGASAIRAEAAAGHTVDLARDDRGVAVRFEGTRTDRGGVALEASNASGSSANLAGPAVGVSGADAAGYGVIGRTDSGVGVQGLATGDGLAGRFDGDVVVTGDLQASNLHLPGVAYSYLTSWAYPSDAGENVLQMVVDVPAAGFVKVDATVGIDFGVLDRDDISPGVVYGVSDDATDFAEIRHAYRLPDGYESGENRKHFLPLSTTAVFAVPSAGKHQFFLRVRDATDNACEAGFATICPPPKSATVTSRSMTAVYFPTSYGPVMGR